MLAHEAEATPPGGFLIAGHSHIFSMGAPWDYRGPVGLSRPLQPFPPRGHFVVEEWSSERSPAYWDCLVQNARGRHVILSFAGNQHISHFLFAPDPMIDFFDPACADAAPVEGATLVPRALIKDHFRPTLEPLPAIVKSVIAAGAASVTVIGTPPPRADMDRFRSRVLDTDIFHRLAEQRGVDISRFSLTPSLVLKKLWGAHQELLGQAAVEAGARFVPVPREACDPDGFLREDHGDDFTHGNHRFGRLMLERAYLAC
jgi:hypothetical protein